MRNIFWSMTLVVACLFGAATAQAQKQVTTNNAIVPGEVWNDTDGNPINAHGGGILYHEGTYYWYGEYKKGKTILPRQTTPIAWCTGRETTCRGWLSTFMPVPQ